MRGRATSVVFLLLVFLPGPPAFAQCSFTPAHSFAFRASFLDIAVDGDDLWAATAYGVQLLDKATDPPSLVASAAVAGMTRVVRLSGGLAYVGSGNSIVVMRKNGRSLEVVRSIDAGAAVSDIAVTPLNLYAATSNGLQQYNLLDFQRTTLATSGANVASLALSGSTLYAADNDSSVEVYDITVPSIPQPLAAIEALPRTTSVKIAGDRLYASDGVQTDVFLRTTTPVTKVTRLPIGSTALARLAADALFVAGIDRRLRAFDFASAGTPVELFAADVVPTGGTINRILALQIAGPRLYAAAGDAGLLSFDIGAFAPPFPLRSHATGATTSIHSHDGSFYASRAGGGISEFRIAQSGQLTAARQWDGRQHRIHDAANRFLLTSSGTTLTYWTVASQSPTLVSSASFSSPVASAIIAGSTAYAVLDDRTLWSADVSQVSPAPQRVPLPSSISPSFIARSGQAVVIADLRDDGTTSVHYFARGDLTATPQTRSVSGLATTGVAVSGSRAAVSTFLGVTLLDFDAGTRLLLSQSQIARLAFAGTKLLALEGRSLTVWNASTGQKLGRFSLPVEGSAIHLSEETMTDIAGIATPEGVMSVRIDAVAQQPSAIPWPSANAYYRRIVATPSRIYLFDGRNADIFSTVSGTAPRHSGALRAPGTIDIAASGERLFALSSSGIVSSYGPDGGDALAQASILEGTDTLPLAIHSVRGAPWATLARGCLSGGCEKKTIVFDPVSLVRTATLAGAAVAVAVSGTKAWSITDLPAEIRSIDASDPLHPSQTASRPLEGGAVSIAHSGGTVYTLGDKLYAYSDTALAPAGEFLTAMAADPAQRVLIDGPCGVVTGRSFEPQFFSVPQWTPIAAPLLPGQARDAAAAGGRLYILTDYSLEIVDGGAAPGAARRRAAK
ncbi:MAG TPA: hypothetical protein VNL91_05620 [Thermoanaerobaculia bacterium]|nr:hypothetical protein [Thermoanaerobaculia bacterium]